MSHLAQLPFRLVTGTILAAALFFKLHEMRLVMGHLDRGNRIGHEGFAVLGLLLVVAGTATLLCLLLAWRTAHRPDGRALALFLACVAYLGSLNGISWMVQGPLESVLARNALESTIPLACMGVVAALLRFSMLFPRPLRAEDLAEARILRRTRIWLLRPAPAWVGALGLALAFQAGLMVHAASEGRSVGSGASSFALFGVGLAGAALAATTLCVASLWTGYRRADAEGRKRIFWVLEGLLIGAVIFLLASVVKLIEITAGYSFPLAEWYAVSVFVALVAILAFLAFAMFYAGALDPTLAIRRTAVFGLLGVVMIFAFAGVEQLVQQYLVRWFGLSDRLGGILTGGTVALAIEPMKRWVGAVVERVAGRLRRVSSAPGEAASGGLAKRGTVGAAVPG